MKISRLKFPSIVLGAGMAALLLLLASDHGVIHFGSAKRPQGGSPAIEKEGFDQGLVKSAAAPMHSPVISASGSPAANTPPAVMAYGELVRQGKLRIQERRRFEAQKWEVDLAKALELPAHIRLERRSGVYQVPGFKYPLVRVDRVYRMDRLSEAGFQPAVNSATSPSAPSQPQAAPESSAATSFADIRPAGDQPLRTQSTTLDTGDKSVRLADSGSGLLDAGGGQVIWENAMVADHLMVQVEEGITRETLQARLPAGAVVGEAITTRGLYLVAVPADGDGAVERAILSLSGLKGVVQFAEPDFLICGADTTPHDPLFTTNAADTSKQWHLPKIMAPRAWDVIKAPKNTSNANFTVVAVVDTGVDYTHPDLAANIWVNPGESGGGKETNGLDDDASGKVDDWHGWNFVEGNNNPMDDVGHGTHVAGIIGSVGDNMQGTTGVCWGVKILPLRIIKAFGTGTYGTYSSAVAAMDYIRTLNASSSRRVAVANHSWGGSGYSLAMLNTINNTIVSSDPLPTGITGTFSRDVNTITVAGIGTEIAKIKIGMVVRASGFIPGGTGSSATDLDTLVTIVNGSTLTLSNYTTAVGNNVSLTFLNLGKPKSYGTVHVAAAGNTGGVNGNVDRIPVYPACLPSGFIVSVGATDATDNVAAWSGGFGSNYGRLNVDLFAPGSSIVSTKWKTPTDTIYDYETRSGTSMAAPQVAGALALMRMWQPNLTELQSRQVLIEQVDQITALQTKCVSGGRLNIAKVIDRLYQPILVGSGGSTGGGGFDGTNPLSASVGLTGLIAVSHADYDVHVLAITQGSVWAWGYSEGGQLGGTYQVGSDWTAESASYRPVKVTGMDDCRMVAARSNRSYALRSDSTVWMWGEDSNTVYNNTPAQIPNLTDVVWIAAEWAVKSDGTVWNFYDPVTQPVQITGPGFENIIMVSDGDQHRLALKRGGTAEDPVYTVWAWGSAANGKLGNGQTSGTVTTPIQVGGLPSDIRYVAAGGSDSYAITEDGHVYYWGKPPGMGAAQVTPALLPNLEGIASISAATLNTVAVTIDGQVLTWGRGYTGQLGSGIDAATTPTSPALVQLPAEAGAALSCSNGGFIGGTVAVMTENDIVYCWGDNQFGALGQGEGQLRAFPTQIAPPGSFTEIFTGDFSGFARDSAARLFGWGTVQNTTSSVPADDLYGQSPKLLFNYPNLIKIDTSLNKRIGLDSDGGVWTWGTSPAPVVGIANAADVSAGGGSNAYFLVALADGTVRAWGENEAGQLGDGTTIDRTTPVQVVGLTGISAVSAATPDPNVPSHSYSFAIKEADGSVFAWGYNGDGQLGDGTTNNSATPIQVAGLTGVSQIAGTTEGTVALMTDGSVWAWSGSYGLTPTQVPGLPPIVRMAVSAPLFIGNDGRVWVLGEGMGPTETGGLFPKPVIGLSNVVQVENTGGCIHALRADGSLWVWGHGLIGVGSMGDGLAWSNLPLPVIGLGGTSTTLSTLGTGITSDSWQLQYFSLAELLVDSLVSDTASPAGDGIPNLIKYALGLDPKQRYDSSSLPVARVELIGGSAESTGASGGGIGLFSVPTVDLTSGKRYMAFTVSRNGIHQDIDYIVEVSTDMVNWQSGDPFTVTVVDTADTLKVYSAASLDDVPRQFMRLKIQRK